MQAKKKKTNNVENAWIPYLAKNMKSLEELLLFLDFDATLELKFLYNALHVSCVILLFKCEFLYLLFLLLLLRRFWWRPPFKAPQWVVPLRGTDDLRQWEGIKQILRHLAHVSHNAQNVRAINRWTWGDKEILRAWYYERAATLCKKAMSDRQFTFWIFEQTLKNFPRGKNEFKCVYVKQVGRRDVLFGREYLLSSPFCVLSFHQPQENFEEEFEFPVYELVLWRNVRSTLQDPEQREIAFYFAKRR